MTSLTLHCQSSSQSAVPQHLLPTFHDQLGPRVDGIQHLFHPSCGHHILTLGEGWSPNQAQSPEWPGNEKAKQWLLIILDYRAFKNLCRPSPLSCIYTPILLTIQVIYEILGFKLRKLGLLINSVIVVIQQLFLVWVSLQCKQDFLFEASEMCAAVSLKKTLRAIDPDLYRIHSFRQEEIWWPNLVGCVFWHSKTFFERFSKLVPTK